MQPLAGSDTTQADYVPYASSEDASVNWDRPADVGRIEARYVRRRPEYAVVYLSSQTGCEQGCRMCHLTATGQTHLRDVTHAEFLEQADAVLDYYRRAAPPAESVHFNFMARGEPLANQLLLSNADELLGDLAARAGRDLRPRHLVSTILPRELGDRPLEDIFRVHHPEIYYSLYSMSESFRRRWLPKALPAEEGLDRLVSWQRQTYKICKIHYAFIAGENDAEADIHAICDALEKRRLMVHVNIVRYNSPDPDRRGVEPPEEIIQRNAAIYQSSRLPYARVRVIPRVGFDVRASCGMFFAPEGPPPEQIRLKKK